MAKENSTTYKKGEVVIPTPDGVLRGTFYRFRPDPNCVDLFEKYLVKGQSYRELSIRRGQAQLHDYPLLTRWREYYHPKKVSPHAVRCVMILAQNGILQPEELVVRTPEEIAAMFSEPVAGTRYRSMAMILYRLVQEARSQKQKEEKEGKPKEPDPYDLLLFGKSIDSDHT